MQTFTTFEGCLDYALGLVTEPGTALEFGVADGHSLRRIVAGMPAGSRVVGFDSFEGLPELWRDGFGIGSFRTTAPMVPGAELVVGLFDESLPEWPVPDDIRLLHVDCDLYASTRTVLDHLGSHLAPGCLIVFDEFHGYDGCEDHEERAWREYATDTIRWTELACGPEQLLIRIEETAVPATALPESSHAPRGYDRKPGGRAR